MGNIINVMVSSAKSDFLSKFAMVSPQLRLLVIMLTNLFSMYFFFLLASYVGNPDVSPEYVIIGNVVQSVATSTLYSTSNVSRTEKHTGTLEPILSSPAKLFHVFLGKSAFGITAGFVSVIVSLSYAAFIFGVDFGSASLVAIAVISVLTCLSLAGMGLAIGGIGIYLRTASILASFFGYIGLLLCGVNFPISYLPDWLQIFSYGMPLTYAVEATRMAVDGATLSMMVDPLMIMTLLGGLYLIMAWFMFRFFENISRKNGKTDSF
ncbi:MAG TPA: ABC transporter permease [Candidatus Methanomethylophilaceae archaeon]|nr:ABC transporter permease [Candidatus Methanomethylophilaceae archaeon]